MSTGSTHPLRPNAQWRGSKMARHFYRGQQKNSRRLEFACPGGHSALRAASKDNPRNLPCPTCHEPDRLTPADKARGYKCDACADRDEGCF